MIGFVAAAALLTGMGLAFVLWPLLRSPWRARASQRAANLAVYRDQFAELERDLALGTLDATQYDSAHAELERRLVDEVEPGPEPTAPIRGPARRLALTLALAVPLSAGLLYWHLGRPGGVGVPTQAATDPSSVTRAEFEAMTENLAKKMATNPEDPVGWLMLGRAYKALERYPEAVAALKEADRRKPNEPEILVEYAEALALASGHNFATGGMPQLERALKIDPNHPKGLTLAGAAAFQAKDYRRAIGYWERVLKVAPAGSELARAVQVGLEQARARAGIKAPAAAPEAIQGEVRLARDLQGRAGPEDSLFVVARAADGPRMPLAVLRRQVKDLPLRFALDDSLAMAPQMKLSGFARIIVTARISKSGEAAPRSGDLQGAAAGPVAPGTRGVTVVIDSVVP